MGKSSCFDKDLTKQFSYSIGGKWKRCDLKQKSFSRLASSFGANDNILFSSGREIIKKMDLKIEKEVIDFESRFVGIQTAKKIQKEIQKRIKHLQTNVHEL